MEVGREVICAATRGRGRTKKGQGNQGRKRHQWRWRSEVGVAVTPAHLVAKILVSPGSRIVVELVVGHLNKRGGRKVTTQALEPWVLQIPS